MSDVRTIADELARFQRLVLLVIFSTLFSVFYVTLDANPKPQFSVEAVQQSVYAQTSVFHPKPPAPPTGFSALEQGGIVRLTWNPSLTTTLQYKLFRQELPTGSSHEIGSFIGGEPHEYVDRHLVNTFTYVYTMVSCYTGSSGQVCSQPTNPVSVKSKATQFVGASNNFFDWSTDRCGDLDFTDLPVRAFRDANNLIHLISPNISSRQWVGPDFNHLTHRCETTLGSNQKSAPAQFDDLEWLAAPYTEDGSTVHALLHMEFRGYTHPDHPELCSTGQTHSQCQFDALTSAVSTDGGNHFTHGTGPSHLVTSYNQRYDGMNGLYGYGEPSNIVRNPNDGYFYFTSQSIYTDGSGHTNSVACMNRFSDFSFSDLRGYGHSPNTGDSFAIRYINPYLPDPDPGSIHDCAGLVAYLQLPLDKPIPFFLEGQSLTYNTFFQKWMLVGVGIYPIREDSRSGYSGVNGVFYYLSDDLINWSGPYLLFEHSLGNSWHQGDPDPIKYVSVIDPTSTSRNFETTSDQFDLYATVIRYSETGGVWGPHNYNADLVKMTVRLIPPLQ